MSFDFLKSDDKEEKISTEEKKFEGKNKRKTRVVGIVENITPTHIIVNVNGNGQRIPYDPEKHTNLKIKSEIEIWT